jgi:hypothetical protein
LALFVARIFALGVLAILGLWVVYLLFSPVHPLLFGVGLALLIIGLRNVKLRKGTVSIRYVTSAPAQNFDVQGWQAVSIGLFRVLLGLGLMLFTSLPRVLAVWGYIQQML